MLDLVVKDGRACGIVVRNLHTGEITSHSAHAVILATGGYGNVFFLSTNAKASNATAHLAGPPAGRAVRQPVLHADPPDVHPGERRLPVEAHADVRVAAQRRARVGAEADGRPALARPDPRGRSRLLPRAPLPVLRQPRAARRGVACDQGDRRRRPRRRTAEERRVPRLQRRHRAPRPRHRSRSATGTCSRCTSASPTRTRTRCRCASIPPIHYTMGGLWVDYELQSTIPGCFVAGEANFSDHGANRLGASALMQGLVRRLLRAAVHGAELPRRRCSGSRRCPTDDPAFAGSRDRRARAHRASCWPFEGTRPVDYFHRELGQHHVGQLRHGALAAEPREGADATSRRCARSSRRTCACSARPRR